MAFIYPGWDRERKAAGPMGLLTEFKGGKGMKTITRQKPYEEILELLHPYDRVFIAGCGTCATTLQTGGVEQVAALADRLRESGILVTGWTVVPTACDEMTSASAREYGGAIQSAAAVLVMACGLGVHRLSLYLSQPVLPGLDTLFLGLEDTPGHFMEVCGQCGQCLLGYTAGICPLVSCHKGLLNGPCGGTNRGKCEVDAEKDCAYTLIYNKLKEQGRLDLLRHYHPPKNHHISLKPREIRILPVKE